ncbi:MAG: toll/interleukin-1 receptor domain-containing protein, partial [Anaerolineales bacterium]|nr:toll/interleukin-1 receptor domain-containing protein [Anaerolineales bacterium]
MMGHIFISYSNKDVEYVERLFNALRREGFNPWLDVNDLEAGSSWHLHIQEQISTCDAFILVMSRNARKSKWVPDELVAAKTRGKPIFP